MSRRAVVAGLVAVNCLLSPNFISADMVLIKGGAIMQGKILSENGKSIKFKNASGPAEFIQKKIIAASVKCDDKVPLGAEQEYLDRIKSASLSDAKAHYEAGLFCLNNSLIEYARKEFNQAVEMDPKYEVAVLAHMKYIDSVYNELPVVRAKTVSGEMSVPTSGLLRDAIILYINKLNNKSDKDIYYRKYYYMGAGLDKQAGDYDAPLKADSRKKLEGALYCYEIVKQASFDDILNSGVIEAKIQACRNRLGE